VNKSESIKSLAVALAKAQGEFKAVPMNSTNPFLKNRYADLGAVIEAAKPVMAANGLAVSQLVGGDGATIAVTTMLMHVSGEWIESTVAITTETEKGKSTAQVAGSIITYLRRYGLAAILGLYADEDADGHQPAPKPAAQPEPVSVKVAPLPYETAKTVTTSDGKVYDQQDDAALAAIHKSIINALVGTTGERRTELLYKLAAVESVQAHRKAA